MTTITSVQCLLNTWVYMQCLFKGSTYWQTQYRGFDQDIRKKIAGGNSTHSPSPFPFQHILTPHIGLTIDWNYYNNLAN